MDVPKQALSGTLRAQVLELFAEMTVGPEAAEEVVEVDGMVGTEAGVLGTVISRLQFEQSVVGMRSIGVHSPTTASKAT